MAISKIPAAGIAADAITAAKLGDNVINSEHYAADSIDAEHLAPNSVNTDSIIDDAVRTAHIQDSQVTVAKLAANSVDSSELINGSVDRVHLAADIVDGTKIADDVINSEHLVAGSIDTEHLGDDQVTAAKLANSINSAIAANTSKTGITSSQATAITAALPKAGGILTGNVRHNDNVKALYGTGSDLEIFHENTNHHSYIWEKGSGDLYLRGTDVRIKSNADNDDMATFIENGAASLFYSNAKKFETTAAGATVTGALTVNGGSVFNEASADVDFRIESNAYTHAFMLQGSDGFVGLGINVPLNLLHLRGGTDNSSTGAPIIRMQKQSGGAVADGHTIGGMSFWVNDDGVDSGAYKERAKIIAESTNTSSATRLELWTGNSNAAIAENVRIQGDGLMTVPVGIALGTAIDAGDAAHTLNDYEEGTATIQWSDGTNVEGSANNCNYTKVGRMVTVTGEITSSGAANLTANAVLKLRGFPFAFNKAGTGAVLTRNFDFPADTINVVVYHAGSGVDAEIFSFIDHGAYTQGICGDLHGSANDMYFTVTYQTDA